MPAPFKHVRADAVIAGFDFSTGAAKGLAFDLEGLVLAEVRLPTELVTGDGVSELSLRFLERQVRETVQDLADRLRIAGRLDDWIAIGISATHHTAARIDANHQQVRRAICWNDQTLVRYHERGLARLGGQARVRDQIGGPWASRYTLSHLVKDETMRTTADWEMTRWIAQHGSLVTGYMTGRFDAVSVSAAASTGIMDLRTCRWQPAMLQAIDSPYLRQLAERQLPTIVDMNEPIGPLLDQSPNPLVFPTSDDQQAGLAGGGAVDAGHVAIVLGNSAVVNSSSDRLPDASSPLDAMRLSWGPYLWMRCFNNGAQFVDHIVGQKPDWAALEAAAQEVPAGCNGTSVLPFVLPEPSCNMSTPRMEWFPSEPRDPGMRFRAAAEALACLIARGVREHEASGQNVTRISVSGGLARSDLMVETLATMLDRPLERLISSEGPALGAAAVALAGIETHERRKHGDATPYTVADAVAKLVKFREPARPRPDWRDALAATQRRFEAQIG